ncbi:MAG: DUF4230 domain-containing protein [Bacteroidota bacterium]|nr:DUF4230 domain-containing protein [Bacteroidota bacterium]
MRQWIWILITLCALGMAFWFGTKLKWPQTQTTESSIVLLERIRTVCKLVTAEGEFAEIYEYKENFAENIPLLSNQQLFGKKALVRVRAKVSVGYDLSKVNMEPNEKSQTLVISNIPPAEIISVEHDLDYYDLSTGIFSQFSTADYNKINANAKGFIISQVQKSSLMNAADDKRDELIGVIRYMVEQAGWTVLIIGDTGADSRTDKLN